MADDIFLSPEEQDERAKKWLKDNGLAIGLGIALGLGAVFAYKHYQTSQQSKAETASQIYRDTLERFGDSEIADIESKVNELKSNHAGSSYAAKAVLLRAKQLSVSDLAAAVTELQWVIDNTSELGLKHTARIRKAKAMLSLGDAEGAILEASKQPYHAYASHYQEILGDAAVKQGNDLIARAAYQAAIDALPDADSSYRGILMLKMNPIAVAETRQADSESASLKTTKAETDSSDFDGEEKTE